MYVCMKLRGKQSKFRRTHRRLNKMMLKQLQVRRQEEEARRRQGVVEQANPVPSFQEIS